MSVRIFSDDELAGLLHRLGGSDDVGFALTALGLANRAAYILTYGPDEDEATVLVSRPRLECATPSATPLDWSASAWAGNLLYNCISNGGTDFAPDEHRLTVLAAADRADQLTLM